MLVTQQEIEELKKFVLELNSNGKSVVVVEGKRDVMALKKIGYVGKILEFHKFGGMIKFADSAARHEKVVFLFDMDRKGRSLTARAIELLQRRTKIDLSCRRDLRIITKGKIKQIEQLCCYGDFLSL